VDVLESDVGIPRMADRRDHPSAWWLWLLLVWTIGAVYTQGHLLRGWVPHDEGSLALSAERVLGGELPHRDFDELYTGGLTYANALAFRLLGIQLTSLRWPLFAVALLWMPAVYSIASRFVPAAGAAAVTLLAVAWSVPNYSAAVPSWYNLFCATFAAWALLRYLDTARRRWLFLAGLLAGVSCAVKIAGLFAVAAALLFFVFLEQDIARSRSADGARAVAYRAFETAGAAALLVVLSSMIAWDFRPMLLLHFVLPTVAVLGLLVRRELSVGPSSTAARFRTFFGMVAPFCTGCLVALLPLLAPYLRAGALGDLIHGVLLAPRSRIQFASSAPLELGFLGLLPAIVLAGILAAGVACRGRLRAALRPLVLLLTIGAVVAAGTFPWIYQALWLSIVPSIPLTVLIGCGLIAASRRAGPIGARRDSQAFLMLTLVALCSLIQFPFAAPIYFCYVAPLLVLALTAVVASRGVQSPFLLGTMVAGYLLFAVLRVTPGFISTMEFFHAPDAQTYALRLPRAAGIRVEPSDGALYEALVEEIGLHARGDYIYAGPDCPEVYFLSGMRNPTRLLFDFLDSPERHDADVLYAIDSRKVNLVAILTEPAFSVPASEGLLSALALRFPRATRIGRFEVRWRD
jgi:hypothetical protein